MAGLQIALDRSDLQRADIFVRHAISQDPAEPAYWLILAELAVRLGRRASALASLDRARQLGGDAQAIDRLVARVPHMPAVVSEKRYLLITEWGAGFWSDVKHVLGSTLLSEMTHRIPVVQWGANSLFSRHGDLNAWTRYFEPLSDAEVSGRTYFPPPWDEKLINSHRLIRETRKFGTYGISLLSRQEEVVVSDTHVSVQDLVPWLDDAGSPYAGMSAWQATQALARKYLVLNGRTRGLVEASRRKLLAGREKWLAVHVRSTDKRAEVKHLDEINASYPERVDAFLKDNPASACSC